MIFWKHAQLLNSRVFHEVGERTEQTAQKFPFSFLDWITNSEVRNFTAVWESLNYVDIKVERQTSVMELWYFWKKNSASRGFWNFTQHLALRNWFLKNTWHNFQSSTFHKTLPTNNSKPEIISRASELGSQSSCGCFDGARGFNNEIKF